MQQANRRRLCLERLETREVPSTTAVVNFNAGTLTVQGTSGNDHLQVIDNAGVLNIYINGRLFSRTFSSWSVDTVVLEGNGGHDVLVTTVTRQTVYLYGSWGNDKMWGGLGTTYFSGGAGNNQMYRRGRSNIFISNGGVDNILGNTGSVSWLRDRAVASYHMTALEHEVIRLINVERQKARLNPLAISSTLAAAARLHSMQMAANSLSMGAAKAMQHTVSGSVYPSMTSRIDYVGYGRWSQVAENIAYGYATATAVVKAWMDSPGHRANILNPALKEIGVSAVAGIHGTLFWTQDFGSR